MMPGRGVSALIADLAVKVGQARAIDGHGVGADRRDAADS